MMTLIDPAKRIYRIGQVVPPEDLDDLGCESCGYEDAPLQVYKYPLGHAARDQLPDMRYDREDGLYTVEQIVLLCDFCTSTFCSSSVMYPRQTLEPGGHHATRTQSVVAYSHNAIMSRLDRMAAQQKTLQKALTAIVDCFAAAPTPFIESAAWTEIKQAYATGTCPRCAEPIKATALACAACGWNNG